MKKNLIFLLIFLLVFSCFKKNSQTSSSDKSTFIAYNFSVNDIYGKKIELNTFRGKVVLLNFWATWCPPCRAEIPDLKKLQEIYSNTLTIIGISVDQEGVSVVRKFYEQMKINYPVIMATEDIIANYGGISAIPTSFVINHKGELAIKIVGYRNFAQYEEILLSYIEQAKNAGKD